ncbi:Gag-pol polymerase [Phytophthora palmivora]|uniref:Gag-pol polymerase n=1 Tax=Phytophthora palmivora TaxID=4796 RepID=A0A2P4WWZ4_9STRA|nr:Gag-pol polymerase [Phytophthora palmivora]
MEAKSDSFSPPASKWSRLTNDDEEVTQNSEKDQQELEQHRQLLYIFLAIWYVTKPPTYRVAMKPTQAKQCQIRYSGTGEIDCFKARLVIKGFLQEHGITITKYSLLFVIKMEVLRLLFTIAALLDLEIHEMNVKTTFLNSFLEEEIYMAQPEGFLIPGISISCCGEVARQRLLSAGRPLLTVLRTTD